MPNAIVIGASSGIGRELAIVLAENGYKVGLVSRRIEVLSQIQSSIDSKSYIKQIDVSDQYQAIGKLNELVSEMGGVDLVIVNAGVGFRNPELDWQPEADTIAVNVSGFAAMAITVFRIFVKQGHGHLVGISSIAAFKGSANSPCYPASKAFEKTYLEGLRFRALKNRLPITVTTIQPGYVDTPLIKNGRGLFWVASPRVAALQIYSAIKRKRKHAYVTRRWVFIAALMRFIPDSIFSRF